MTTATTPAELESQLINADTDKIGADPAGFGKLVKDYVAATVAASGETIKGQVVEQTSATLVQMLKDAGYAEGQRPDVRAERPASRSRAGDRGHMHNPEAAGAQLDGKFTNIGQLLQDLHLEKRGNNPESARRLGELRNAFSSTVPAEGGFLIPEEFRSDLMTTAMEGAIVRPRARVIPMGVPRINLPRLEDTDHSGALFGGITAYWSEEGATLQNSSGKFGRITMDAQKLTMRTSLPNELVADSAISITSFVDQAFPETLRWYEDDGFIRGNGVGKPLGFLDAGNTAAVTVAKESGQAADTIAWENLVKMYARMLPTSIGSAVWLANLDTFPQLATMALNVGTGGSAIWLNNGVAGPPLTILGRPVVFTEKMPTLGDEGDISFVDFSYYLIGDRQQMTAMWSEHVEFNTDSVAYRLISRVDGRPWLKNAITPNKGANTLSPFVKLAARA